VNKFKAKRINTPDGIFDSIGEYKYWLQLNTLKSDVSADRQIINIERQVVYKFIINKILIGKYIADFVITYSDATLEVHDFKNPYLLGKGKSTSAGAMFQYKKKLMLALYNIEVKTITNENTKNRKSKSKRD
jgi:hypothetical protein